MELRGLRDDVYRRPLATALDRLGIGHIRAVRRPGVPGGEAFLPDGFRLACQARIGQDDRDIRFEVLRRRLRILGASEPGPDEMPF